jgi:RND superfamily putative drug exporter
LSRTPSREPAPRLGRRRSAASSARSPGWTGWPSRRQPHGARRPSCGKPGQRCSPLRSDRSPDELIDSATTLREDLSPGRAQNGVTVYLAGQPTIWAGLQDLSKRDLAQAETSGFPIVALILLVVFGSLAAAALPLALGFVSVVVTGALIYFISLQMTTPVFVTNMASMIGIGVAVDYSLFILARFREERGAGQDPNRALATALATSGLAVSFSGLAVIVSLAGLWMVDNQALRSMALGAMTVVAVSILTATTLLPALIATLGDRVLPGGIVARVLRLVRHPFRASPPPPDAGARAGPSLFPLARARAEEAAVCSPLPRPGVAK